MARLWRIVVLLLAVVPLAVPAVSLSQNKPCKMPIAMDHSCCPEGAKVAAAVCCDAKTDAALNENKDAAAETALLVISQAASTDIARVRTDRGSVPLPQAAFIPILLPLPILRT